jgi:sugar/nucleoside kinase (ribokinase family)
MKSGAAAFFNPTDEKTGAMHNRTGFDIVILGHFARDVNVVQGVAQKALGGAVYYGGMALARLNVRAGIITRLARADFGCLDTLRRSGLAVFAQEADQTSGIRNTYTTPAMDRRVCEPLGFAGEFEIGKLPDVITKIFHIGPIIAGEVSPELLALIVSRYAWVSLDLQGVLRVRENGKLVFRDWPEKQRLLRGIRTIKADTVEAEVITGEADRRKAARQIAEWGPREIVITARDGVLVYAEGEIFEAPFTPRSLVGRTGRGDTCIAAYLAARLQQSPSQAVRFAAAVTSLKLEQEGPFNRDGQAVREKLARDYSEKGEIP